MQIANDITKPLSNPLSSPVIFIGQPAASPAAEPESAAESAFATETEPATGMETGETALLIDWNAWPPDGTEQSLAGVLKCVASAFGGQVFVGLCGASGELQQHASRPIEQGAQAVVRSAVTEAAQPTQVCLFAAANGQSSLVLQQLRRLLDVPLVLGFSCGASAATPNPLHSAGEIGWVVGVDRTERLPSTAQYARLMAQTQREFPAWLQIWLHCRTACRVDRWRQRMLFYRHHRSRLGVLLAGLLLASMAIPLPYWPQCPCVVEPAQKSYVSSPIDGRIRAAQVRPGDVVAAGQILAQLDPEQIQWQLAAAEAEYEAAGKKRDTALATRAGGELRLAQLEQEKIALQIESLQRQLERLELRSPTAGVVVQGDWYQSDGAPVSRGDMLFEIAEMDRMRVEIHLSTDDLARLAVGDQATVRVDAAPGAKWSSQLTRIDPRGQVVDTAVVFGATIDVANDTHQLRPGMKGTARISAGSQRLGWLLFHRPLSWAMKKLAW